MKLAFSPTDRTRLIGHGGELEWAQGKDSLATELPKDKPCEHAFVFAIGR